MININTRNKSWRDILSSNVLFFLAHTVWYICTCSRSHFFFFHLDIRTPQMHVQISACNAVMYLPKVLFDGTNSKDTKSVVWIISKCTAEVWYKENMSLYTHNTYNLLTINPVTKCRTYYSTVNNDKSEVRVLLMRFGI